MTMGFGSTVINTLAQRPMTLAAHAAKGVLTFGEARSRQKAWHHWTMCWPTGMASIAPRRSTSANVPDPSRRVPPNGTRTGPSPPASRPPPCTPLGRRGWAIGLGTAAAGTFAGPAMERFLPDLNLDA